MAHFVGHHPFATWVAATYMIGVPQGFPSKDMTKLEDYGFVASRPRGEYHANNQQMAKLLHKAIGLGGKKAAPMVSRPTLCIDMLCHHGSACRVCQILASTLTWQVLRMLQPGDAAPLLSILFILETGQMWQ